jgi:hypothetical protein
LPSWTRDKADEPIERVQNYWGEIPAGASAHQTGHAEDRSQPFPYGLHLSVTPNFEDPPAAVRGPDVEDAALRLHWIGLVDPGGTPG